MKVGDLVRMKREVWATATARRVKPSSHEDVGVVYDIAGKGLKVLMPSGDIKVGLTEYWEVLNE